FAGAERDQADHRAQTHGYGLAIDEQLVVVEAVLLAPQAGAAQTVHGVGDRDVVLEELGRDVLVGWVLRGQLQRDGEHGAAVERHPRGAVGLLQLAASRQGLRAIEHADVVEPEESAAEQVFALEILLVHPPGEIDEQLLEDALEEAAIAMAL